MNFFLFIPKWHQPVEYQRRIPTEKVNLQLPSLLKIACTDRYWSISIFVVSTTMHKYIRRNAFLLSDDVAVDTYQFFAIRSQSNVKIDVANRMRCFGVVCSTITADAVTTAIVSARRWLRIVGFSGLNLPFWREIQKVWPVHPKFLDRGRG